MLQELLFYQGIMTLNFTEMKWDYPIGKNGKIENNGMDCLIEWFRQKKSINHVEKRVLHDSKLVSHSILNKIHV